MKNGESNETLYNANGVISSPERRRKFSLKEESNESLQRRLSVVIGDSHIAKSEKMGYNKLPDWVDETLETDYFIYFGNDPGNPITNVNWIESEEESEVNHNQKRYDVKEESVSESSEISSISILEQKAPRVEEEGKDINFQPKSGHILYQTEFKETCEIFSTSLGKY